MCFVALAHAQNTANSITAIKPGTYIGFTIDFSEIMGMSEKEFSEHEEDWEKDKSTIVDNFLKGLNLTLSRALVAFPYANKDYTLKVNVKSISTTGKFAYDATIVDKAGNCYFKYNIDDNGKKASIAVLSKLARIKTYALITGQTLGSAIRTKMGLTTSQARKQGKEGIEEGRKAAIDSIKRANPDLIFAKVGSGLNIKDKIFVVNKSQHYIQQLAIVKFNKFGEIEVVCIHPKIIAPGQTCEIASYDDEELERLHKQTLAFKIKGSRKSQSDADDKDVTYKFNVKLSEEDHDLYVEVSKPLDTFLAPDNVLDF